jgi:hypothetical protein
MVDMEDVKTAFDLAIAMPGGGLTALLLWPFGCSTDTVIEKDPLCSDGDPTNFFGSTMLGLVGNGNSNDAFLFGLGVAFLIFCALAAYQALGGET